MITFERTFDYELVRSIITSPKLWDKLSDDYSPPVADYRPIESEAVWYVLATDVYVLGESDLLGLWMLHPQNGVCWEVHTALLPFAWGELGLEAARALPAWIWAHTACKRIITSVPANNRLALHFAMRAGMRAFGVNEKSYQKGGELWDQIMLGISAPAEKKKVEDESMPAVTREA